MATKLDLIVDVIVKGQKGLLKGLGDDLDTAGKKADGLKQKFSDTFSKKGLAIGAFAGLTAGVAAFTAGIANAVGSLIRIEQITAQTKAVIESTGGAAGVTTEHVIEFSSSLEDLTGVEQETIQEGQNLLLTFTNIRNVVGAGNDIFDQATTAITDMSVALGQDMKSSAIQLGKALNDPIKGITALQRVGVSFTREQKAQVQALVESGDTLKAQKLILHELAIEFGGAAEAFGQTTAGKLERAQHKIGSFFESITIGAADMGTGIAHSADTMAMNFGEQGDRVHDIADKFGKDFNDLKIEIAKHMMETGESFDESADFIENRARESGIATATEYARGLGDERPRGALVQEVDNLSQLVISQMHDHWDEIRLAGSDMVAQFNVGIFDAQTSLQTEIDSLLKALDERMTPAEEIGKLHGQKMTFALAREAAVAAGDDAAVAKIDEMLAEIAGQINALSGLVAPTGANIVTAIINSMRQKLALQQTKDDLYAIGGIIRAGIGIESEPKDPRSPLRGITTWGGNMVETIADGITSNLGVAREATNALASAFVLSPETVVPRITAPAAPRFFGPSRQFVDDLALNEFPTRTAGAVGGVNVNLTVNGDLKASERTLPGIIVRGLYASGFVQS